MKKKFILNFLGIYLISNCLAFGETPKKTEEKIKITDELIAKSSYCEPLLRTAQANEELVKKIFLQSTNKVLNEYIKEHLYTCFNLIDNSLKGSSSFAKALIEKYPILFGDLENPAHSDKDVILSAASSMNKFKYCHLPILELPKFASDKTFKDSLVKVNPICRKYVSDKDSKEVEKENKANMSEYYKSLMSSKSSNFEDREIDDSEAGAVAESAETILDYIRKSDNNDRWFFETFRNSSSYAELMIDYPENHSLVLISEKDLETILSQLEKYEPKADEYYRGNDASLALNTVYRLYFEKPEDLVFKKIESRLMDKKNIEKVIKFGDYSDKMSDYLGVKIESDPELLKLFISSCNPYKGARDAMKKSFWKKLKPDILRKNAPDIAPCVDDYKEFFSAIPDYDKELVLKTMAQVTELPDELYWLIEYYRNLKNDLKSDIDVSLAMIFPTRTDLFSLLPEKHQKDAKIKLHALKYLPTCDALLDANPDDQSLLMDIYFPEKINHDLEFLFGKSKEKILTMSNNLTSQKCFSRMSDRVRGNPEIALPIFKQYPDIWESITEPASLTYDVLKETAANRASCDPNSVKKAFPKLSRDQKLEIVNLNINCIMFLPTEQFDEGFYKKLTKPTTRILISFLEKFPLSYKKDINILRNIDPIPDILNNPPTTEEQIAEARRTYSPVVEHEHEEESDVEESDEVREARKAKQLAEMKDYYINGLVWKKNEYDALLGNYNKKIKAFITSESIIEIIQKETITNALNYFRNHFYFVNFRQGQGPKFFTQYRNYNPEYVGYDFKPFMSQLVWTKLADKVLQEKLSCDSVKDFFQYQSEFWLESSKEITQKLKCVQNWANQIPVEKKNSGK